MIRARSAAAAVGVGVGVGGGLGVLDGDLGRRPRARRAVAAMRHGTSYSRVRIPRCERIVPPMHTTPVKSPRIGAVSVPPESSMTAIVSGGTPSGEHLHDLLDRRRRSARCPRRPAWPGRRCRRCRRPGGPARRSRARPRLCQARERLVLVRLLLRGDRRPTSRTGSPSPAGRPRPSRSPRGSARATGSCTTSSHDLPLAAKRSATSLRIAVWNASTVGVADSRAHLSGYGRSAPPPRGAVSVISPPRWSSAVAATAAGPGRGAAAASPRAARAARRPRGTPLRDDRAAPSAVLSTEPLHGARAPRMRSASCVDVRRRVRRRRSSPAASRSSDVVACVVDDLGRAAARAPTRAAGRARARPRPARPPSAAGRRRRRPCDPSTVTSRPVQPAVTSSPTPTTLGRPSARVTTAACEVAPPRSVTTARAAIMPATSSGLVVGRDEHDVVVGELGVVGVARPRGRRRRPDTPACRARRTSASAVTSSGSRGASTRRELLGA